jgi:hypothetical protein
MAMVTNANFGRRTGNDAEQMLSPQMVSASSTIPPEHVRVAEPDAPEASPEADWLRCCRPILLTIRWETIPMSQHSYPTALIGFAEGNCTRVSPMPWAT